MKIDLILPGGRALHLELPPRKPKTPMSRERFEALFWLSVLLIVAETSIRFFAMIV